MVLGKRNLYLWDVDLLDRHGGHFKSLRVVASVGEGHRRHVPIRDVCRS